VRQLNSRRVTTALSDLVQAALLLEAAQGELDASGDARKAAVARFFIRERLGGGGALRGISDDRSVLDLFDSITRYQPLEPAQLPTAV
ncbi:MAG: acyl-CoA dehydrogenase, partial [Chloroflexi bacterium]|nr:acyl-CoA dehydrogenase [Chloroflexota bacterium]